MTRFSWLQWRRIRVQNPVMRTTRSCVAGALFWAGLWLDPCGHRYDDLMDDLETRFTFHAPDDERADQHVAVRAECHRLADFLNYQLLDGREKSLAITKLEEVMFWANAAVARQGA
jgi:hypothetical protein